VAAEDACAAPQNAGFDSRTTKHKYRPIMVILVHSYWGFYHLPFTCQILQDKI